MEERKTAFPYRRNPPNRCESDGTRKSQLVTITMIIVPVKKA